MNINFILHNTAYKNALGCAIQIANYFWGIRELKVLAIAYALIN
jgi:hypothetical protein